MHLDTAPESTRPPSLMRYSPATAPDAESRGFGAWTPGGAAGGAGTQAPPCR